MFGFFTDPLVLVNVFGSVVPVNRHSSRAPATLWDTCASCTFISSSAAWFLLFFPPVDKVTYAAGETDTIVLRTPQLKPLEPHADGAGAFESVMLSCPCQDVVTFNAPLAQYNGNLNKQYAVKKKSNKKNHWGQ